MIAMLSLTKELEHSFFYKNREYEIDLSFDNVLRWYKLLEDMTFNPEEKAHIGFEMFFKACTWDERLLVESLKSVSEYLQKRPYGGGKAETSSKKYYSFTQDAEAIYASFMQDYHIDLIDMQGKLHWDKFIALFAGLTEKTYFKTIVRIRTCDTSDLKGASLTEFNELRENFELDEYRTEEAHSSEANDIFNALKQQAINEGRVK